MMIATMIAAAMMLQGGSADLRTAYRTCLNEAVASAKGAKVGADGFKDYAQKTCSTASDGFKATLVKFNVKNGMSKKAASEDADIQLDDYIYTAGEKYRYSLEPE